MPTFRFRGFPAASTVALSVAQGAATQNAVVAAWAQGSPASLTIDVYGDDGRTTADAFIAPVGVHFEARPLGFAVSERVLPPPDFASTPGTSTVRIYDEAFHEISYFWTVTRPAGAASTFSNGLNVPAAWNNRNTAYGKQVAFCFDVPGNYTVECFAVDEVGNTATATVTFNNSGGTKPAVRNPDSVFTTTNTICINPTGDSDFSWAPAGARQYRGGDGTSANDVAAFQRASTTLLGVDNADQNWRILFKPGATYDFTSVSTVAEQGSPNWDCRRLHIGAPAGTPPVLNYSSQILSVSRLANIASFAIYNLDCRGGWDEETETGSTATQPFSMDAVTCYTLHKLSVRGAAVNFGLHSDVSPHFVNNKGTLGPYTFSECTSTSWRTYGFFFNPLTFNTDEGPLPTPSRFAMIGVKSARSPDCISEETPNVRAGDRNDSGPFRFGYFDRVYVGCCDFFSNDPLRQPAMRFFNAMYEQGKPSRRGWPYTNVERVVAENGTQSGMWPNNKSAAGSNNPSQGRMPANTVLDKVIYIGGPWTTCFIGAEWATGLTMRNTLFVVPGVSFVQGSARELFSFNDGFSTPADAEDALLRAQPVRLYNITMVNLRTNAQNNNVGTMPWYPSADQTFFDGHDVLIENSVRHLPNFSSPVNAGPFATPQTLSGVTPRFKGRRWNWGLITLTGLNVAPGGTFFIAYTSIPAQNANGAAATQPTQSYWTTNPTHNFHYISNGTTAYRDRGQTSGNRITASYGATGITFTNNTNVTLTGTWYLFVDRRALLPATVTTSGTPTNLALSWVPAPGSAAITTEDLGLLAVDDFLGRTRTVPRTRGAFEAA